MLQEIKIPQNPMEQSFPFFLYYRFRFLAGETVKYFNYHVDAGYFYNIKFLIAKMPFKDLAGNNLFAFCNIDVRNTDRNKVRNNVPYQLNLVCSPGNDSVVHPAPLPVDTTAFSVNFTAEPFKNTLLIDDIYSYRSAIFFKLELDRVLANTTYVDIMARGYNVLENRNTDFNN